MELKKVNFVDFIVCEVVLVFEMFKRTGTDAVYEIEEYQLQEETGCVFSNEVKQQVRGAGE